MSPEEFIQLLGEAPRRLSQASFKEPLKEAARAFGEQVEQNFVRQVDSDGNAWKPHAPATIAMHGPHPLLRLTWTMYAAATNMDHAAAKQLIEHWQITVGIDGTEIPYAKTQQEGEGRVPQREFFYLSEEGVPVVRDRFAEAARPTIEKEVFR